MIDFVKTQLLFIHNALAFIRSSVSVETLKLNDVADTSVQQSIDVELRSVIAS